MKLATWIATGILLALVVASLPLALFDPAYLIGPGVIWIALLAVNLVVAGNRANKAANEGRSPESSAKWIRRSIWAVLLGFLARGVMVNETNPGFWVPLWLVGVIWLAAWAMLVLAERDNRKTSLLVRERQMERQLELVCPYCRVRVDKRASACPSCTRDMTPTPRGAD